MRQARDTASQVAIQHGQALGARAARRCDIALGAHVGARGALQGHVAGGRRAHGTSAGRAAWACCWPTGCALDALSLFLTRFDSVLFPSQFLDIVREPGS